MSERPIAIVSAMHEELRALVPLLEGSRTQALAGRVFHVAELHGRPVVLALSGIGKVAAATTATLMLQAFDVRALVLTGVAGGLHESAQVGDIVLAREALQHDMDASPLFPRFEVPLTGRSRFGTDDALGRALAAAASHCIAHAGDLIGAEALQGFGIAVPRLHQGLVVSGDRFVSTSAESAALRALLPDALAVEMEGAAMAQVCADFGVPFANVRTISDRADDSAHVDFARFIAEVASAYTRAIVGAWLQSDDR